MTSEQATTDKTAASGQAPSPQSGGSRKSLTERRDATLQFLMANALLIGLLLLIAFFSVAGANFLTTGNITDILSQSAATMVVAVPAALLLISGKVDLSVGSTLALGAVVTGLLVTDGTHAIVAATAAIAAGALIGLFNGVAVGVLRLSPIIVTLGMLTAVRGLALAISPEALYGFPSGLITFGNEDVLGVPYLVIVAIGAIALGTVVLNLLPVGRHIFAIGVNERAAVLSGVRVKRTVLWLFVFSGAGAGLAGVMFAARLGSAPSGTLGVGFELVVLTAVLLGGVAFTGGRGSIRGVVLGVLFLAIIQNGLTNLNAPTAAALLVSGLALVVAALLDRFSETAGPTGRTTDTS